MTCYGSRIAVYAVSLEAIWDYWLCLESWICRGVDTFQKMNRALHVLIGSCVCIYIYIYIYIYIPIHMHMYICSYVHIEVHIHTYIYIYISVWVCGCAFVFACAHFYIEWERKEH